MNPERILVVVDDENLLYAYSRMIEAEGHRVVTASTGGEAFEVANRERPALVVLDAVLPDAPGSTPARVSKGPRSSRGRSS